MSSPMDNALADALSTDVDAFALEMTTYLESVPATDDFSNELRQIYVARLSAMKSELSSFREKMRGLRAL